MNEGGIYSTHRLTYLLKELPTCVHKVRMSFVACCLCALCLTAGFQEAAAAAATAAAHKGLIEGKKGHCFNKQPLTP